VSHPDLVDLARSGLVDPDALYLHWYLRHEDESAQPPKTVRPAISDLVAALRAAHAATSHFEPGWHVRSVSSAGRIVAESGPATRLLGRADVLPLAHPALVPAEGSDIEVSSRIDSIEASPGFWLTGQGPWLDAPPAVPLARVYLRMPWWETPTLVAAVTAALGATGEPWLLKVALPDATGVRHRADAAVLYVARPADGRLPPAITAVADRVVPLTDGPLPRLVAPLRAGVGAADDPGGAESFGTNRCRLLATALATAGPTPEDRLTAMEAALRAAGIDPARPHLASADHAPLTLDEHPAMRSSTAVLQGPGNAGAVATVTPVARSALVGSRWACDAAIELGRRLAAEAVWHDGRCTWLGLGVTADGTIAGRSADGDLYSGTAGIGWALAHLARLGGGEHVERAAIGAFEQAFLWAETASPPPSFYAGSLGVAWAAVTAGRAAGWPSLVDRGAELAHAGVAKGPPEASGCDLLAGDAGLVLGLADLAHRLEDAALAAAADRVAERLQATVQRDGPFACWPSDVSPTDPPPCGLGHGASGIALALTVAARDAGRRPPDEVDAALAYERAWWKDGGGWPDLRGVAPGGPITYGAPGWCHGASGIGVARLALHALEPAERTLAEVGAAVDVATRIAAASLGAPVAQREAGANLSVCHGIGSVAELHLIAAELLGDDEHLGHAERLLARALDTRPGQTWDSAGPIPCGLPGGESPGLLLGLAGIAIVLMRLGAPGAAPSPALLAVPLGARDAPANVLSGRLPQ
jgi:hypothetical protein